MDKRTLLAIELTALRGIDLLKLNLAAGAGYDYNQLGNIILGYWLVGSKRKFSRPP